MDYRTILNILFGCAPLTLNMHKKLHEGIVWGFTQPRRPTSTIPRNWLDAFSIAVFVELGYRAEGWQGTHYIKVIHSLGPLLRAKLFRFGLGFTVCGLMLWDQH